MRSVGGNAWRVDWARKAPPGWRTSRGAGDRDRGGRASVFVKMRGRKEAGEERTRAIARGGSPRRNTRRRTGLEA